ncbi:hypothetical protein DFH06DRAFT_1244846 [Mycena polygramma]|nr:hypothetical protein DFH06DRAFT_1244846 [Mycena polygramma]
MFGVMLLSADHSAILTLLGLHKQAEYSYSSSQCLEPRDIQDQGSVLLRSSLSPPTVLTTFFFCTSPYFISYPFNILPAMIAAGVDTPLILGVMEIGVFLSLVMFGVVALQGYVYFRNCHSDRAGMKTLVGSVLIFELCHSIASCHAIYYFTVILAGVPEFEKPANSYSVSLLPVFETLITALVQGFFAYRIRLLSGRIYFSLVCWALCFVRFVGGMAVAAVGFLDIPLEPDYFHLQDTYGWLITSSLSVGVAVDVLISLLLCFYIRQLYTPSPYNLPRSEQLIHRLIVWTIQTGLITSNGRTSEA